MTARTRRKKLRHVSIAPGASAREPNGRLSRRRVERAGREAVVSEEARAVAVEARMGVFGLSRAEAEGNTTGGPNAGSLQGRMRLAGIKAELGREPLGTGTLSAAQFQAAEWWLGTRLAYLRAIAAPGRTGGETGSGTAGIATEEDAARWARGAIALWDRVRACLQSAATETRAPIAAALDLFLIRGEYMPHLEGNLRLGLNAVHRMFVAGR